MTTDGLGTWVAVWASGEEFGDNSDGDILFARSTDGGATWSDPVAIDANAATDSRYDLFPQLTTDRQGTWVAVWLSAGDFGDPLGSDGDVLFARAQGLGGCAASATGLCLDGARFRVGTSWRTPQGDTGEGRAIPLTNDTGYFWFFRPANVEMVVKVLDACVPQFDRFWVFAGGLTNVEVTTTVVDTLTGDVRTYVNPLGTPFRPLQDTDAFATCSAASESPAAEPLTASAARPFPPLAAAETLGTCTPDATSLCLNGSRFRVTAQWRTLFGTMGPAHAEPLTPATPATSGSSSRPTSRWWSRCSTPACRSSIASGSSPAG